MNEPPPHEMRALILTPSAKDAAASKQILEENCCQCHVCTNLDDLCREAAEGAGVVLVTAEALTSDSEGMLLTIIDKQPAWSDLPIVILLPAGPDRPEAYQAFERYGNITLMKRPVELSVFLSIFRAALRDRSRQYEVRHHLVTRAAQAEELELSRERLLDNSRRKDEFLAMLAHELRNPLAAVGNAVAVLRASPRAENVEFAREIIERQTKQLARLIDDLLDVSRLTTGKVRLQRELVDAGSILSHTIKLAHPLIEERRHQLFEEFEIGTMLLIVDPMRVEQIFLNLLTNSAKYTPPNGTIRITAALEGEEIVINVIDNGAGIPPEKLPSMFELFRQGDRSLDRIDGGLGIGLTIVKTLTEMHGGTVSAHSEGVGKGSRFTVRLPTAAKTLAQMPRSERERHVRKARVLVVDSAIESVRGVGTLLELLGSEVMLCHDGAEAVAAARSFKPDYVLLDVAVPGPGGRSLAEAIRSETNTVVIGISGYQQPLGLLDPDVALFDHHLRKPIDFDSLVSLMRTGEADAAHVR